MSIETAIREHFEANEALSESITPVEAVDRSEKVMPLVPGSRRALNYAGWAALVAAAALTVLLIGLIPFLTSAGEESPVDSVAPDTIPAIPTTAALTQTTDVQEEATTSFDAADAVTEEALFVGESELVLGALLETSEVLGVDVGDFGLGTGGSSIGVAHGSDSRRENAGELAWAQVAFVYRSDGEDGVSERAELFSFSNDVTASAFLAIAEDEGLELLAEFSGDGFDLPSPLAAGEESTVTAIRTLGLPTLHLIRSGRFVAAITTIAPGVSEGGGDNGNPAIPNVENVGREALANAILASLTTPYSPAPSVTKGQVEDACPASESDAGRCSDHIRWSVRINDLAAGMEYAPSFGWCGYSETDLFDQDQKGLSGVYYGLEQDGQVERTGTDGTSTGIEPTHEEYQTALARCERFPTLDLAGLGFRNPDQYLSYPRWGLVTKLSDGYAVEAGRWEFFLTNDALRDMGLFERPEDVAILEFKMWTGASQTSIEMMDLSAIASVQAIEDAFGLDLSHLDADSLVEFQFELGGP